MEKLMTPGEAINTLKIEKEQLEKDLKEGKRKQNELEINYKFSENKRIQDFQNYKTVLDSLRYPDMAIKVEIDEEFKSIIPSMTAEEYQGLEAMIIKEGCRDPLILWKTEDGRNILVGGHNRYKICKKNDLSYKVVQKHFTSRDEVLMWIIDDQLGRRNLTPEQKSYLVGKKYLEEKKKVGAHEGNQHSNLELGQSGPIPNLNNSTAKKVARLHKIGETTVKRDANYTSAVDNIDKVDNSFRAKILNREVKTSKGDVIKLAKLPTEEQKEIVEEIKSGNSLADALKKREANEEFVLEPIDKELAEIEQKCSGLTKLIVELTKTIKEYERNDKEFSAAYEAMQELHKILYTAFVTYGHEDQSYLDFTFNAA